MSASRVRDSAKAGVAVRDGVRKSMLGEITEVSASPAFQMKADMETGEVKRAEIEGRYNVTVTCKAQGSFATAAWSSTSTRWVSARRWRCSRQASRAWATAWRLTTLRQSSEEAAYGKENFGKKRQAVWRAQHP